MLFAFPLQPSPVPPSALAAASPFLPPWNAPAPLASTAVAWGDVDNDGDLDLAVGNTLESDQPGPSQLYRNQNGQFLLDNAWTPAPANTRALAWGDVDNDGDLDLAVGNFDQPNQLYRNQRGQLALDSGWVPPAGQVGDLAWGDVDNDGDLDLAVGNFDQPNQLYRNQQGRLALDTAWQPAPASTSSLAWGDLDNDGDLDLAVGNNDQPNQLYRNQTGRLRLDSDWKPVVRSTNSLAWGDADNDGDLDLAVGNAAASNQLYRNLGGRFAAAETLGAQAFTNSLAWGDVDNDGDLDLAVGNLVAVRTDPSGYAWPANQLYRNNNGVLTLEHGWMPDAADTTSLAWGDLDNNGSLDLAVANVGQPVQVYRNGEFGKRFTSSWQATLNSVVFDLAWGDLDQDDDLDLVVSAFEGAQLYRSQNGQLVRDLNWTAPEDTTAVAWGDVDNDSDLDLIVGSLGRNRLFRNDDGRLIIASALNVDRLNTQALAWGDVDNDGDLDLAVGNFGQPNQLYRNQVGRLVLDAGWTPEAVYSQDLAWGDVDNDGDLDLAVGNSLSPNQLYRNSDGRLLLDRGWSPPIVQTESLAWGDVDNDGDLDLAVGSYNAPNQLYRNQRGILVLDNRWSPGRATTQDLAWGDADNDGDLDLAVSFADHPGLLYRNQDGLLSPIAEFGQPGEFPSVLAWGDSDRDGDLDLASYTAGRLELYRNRGSGTPLLPNNPPQLWVAQPGRSGAADLYASAEVLSSTVIPISYTVSDPEGDAVRLLRGEFSLDGRAWLTAVAATGTLTGAVSAQRRGTSHVFLWDTFASGLFGQSDNVLFRLVVVPGPQSLGPFRWPTVAATTLPFRVRGTQVRVLHADGSPARNALVFRRSNGQDRGQLIADSRGNVLRSTAQGYLQGRGQIRLGDELVALLPISATQSYTLYHSSASPTTSGLDARVVVASGVQNLTVAAQRPLITFNLTVSLEWDARYDRQYLATLERDLRRSADLIYDWTEGQATVGDIVVYHDKQFWDDAHVRIYASNRLRPNANQGGIVTEVLSETLALANLTRTIEYEPGQIRMGATWNRFGETSGSLAEDWPRILAHEFGHFALFLDDNYLGLDAQSRLIPVEDCRGAMSDPYSDTGGEFHPPSDWLPGCARTLSNLESGRSDWATIARFYPALRVPTTPYAGLNSGPTSLPLALTRIRFVEPAHASQALEVPIFYLKRPDGTPHQASASARSFLFRNERVVDLGSPNGDQLLARGAQPADRLCLYDLEAGLTGCTILQPGDEQLLLRATAWRPDVAVTPITSRTLAVDVRGAELSPTASLRARIYPGYVAPGEKPFNEITLQPNESGYRGLLNSATGGLAVEGFVQLWVEEGDANARREIITDYTLGGNPGKRRARLAPRGNPGKRRARLAPVVSSDGQAILYNPGSDFAEGTFYVLQPTTSVPDPPPGRTVVGRAYRLSTTPGLSLPSGSSLSLSYLARELPDGQDEGMRVYYQAAGSTAWQELPSISSRVFNEVAAEVPGPGVYVLMTSLRFNLRGPSWNLLAYPLARSRALPDALAAVAGGYTIIHHFDPSSGADDDNWRSYAPAPAPEWVSDLDRLRFGESYWIYATQDSVLHLGEGSTPEPAATTPGTPPALIYGWVGSEATPGQAVVGLVNGIECGRGSIQLNDGQLVYRLRVAGVGPDTPACGRLGQPVVVALADGSRSVGIVWDNRRATAVSLPAYIPYAGRLYLPLIRGGLHNGALSD